MPYFVQSAAYVGIPESPATVGAVLPQICETVSCLEAMTCDSIVDAVSHSGVNRTEGTFFSEEMVAPESAIEPLMMPFGGLTFARR